MDSKDIKTSDSLVRIDKNIANNSDAVALAFGQGNDELAMSLLIFCALQRKNKLFDFGLLDPEKFAKSMGFAPKYLTSIHPHPACFEGKTKEQIAREYKNQQEHPEDPEYRVFDSRLENALYLLLSRNITYRRPGKKYKIDGNSVETLDVTSCRLFKRFSLILKKSPRGKKKLYYDYELDEGFCQNLSLLYVTADINDFTALRKKSLHKLYLYVKNLRELALYKKEATFTCEFDTICEIANINSAEPKDCKKRLVKAFEILQKYIKIELKWKKRNPSDRWPYVPVIIFKEITNNIIPEDKADRIAEKVDIFYLNFMEQVIAAYKEENGYEICIGERDMVLVENIIIEFLQKCKKSDIDAWYKQAQLCTFAKTNDKTYEQIELFFKHMPEFKSYADIKIFLYQIFKNIELLKPAEATPVLTLDLLKKKYKTVFPVECYVTAEFKKSQEELGYTLVNLGGVTYSCK